MAKIKEGKSIDFVNNVELKVFLNGTLIAVSDIQVNFNINNLPSAQIRLALGEEYGLTKGQLSKTPADGKAKTDEKAVVVDPATIEEGDAVVIHYVHKSIVDTETGGFIFKGIVSGVATSKAPHGEGGISMGAVVTLIHELSKLGGLPPVARAFLLEGSASSCIEKWRYLKGGIVKDDDDSTAISGLQKKVDKGGMSPAEFIIKALNAMYKAESAQSLKDGQTPNRAVDDEAVDALNSIVIGEMQMSLPTAAPNRKIKTELANLINTGWRKTNTINLLIGAMRQVFGAFVPTSTTAHLVPNFPLSKTAVTTVKASEIFSITNRSTMDPIPIVGVRLLYEYNSNDAIKSNTSGAKFVQYPTPSVKGVYKYVDAPKWARLNRDLNESKAAAASQTGTKSEPQKKGKVVTANKNNSKVPVTEIKEWANKVAKTIFNTDVWMKNSATISVPLSFNCAPGMVIKLDLSGDNSAKQLFGSTILYGQVAAVNITSKFGAFRMNVQVNYLRTEEDNEKYGFETHPVYDAYKMENIPLYGSDNMAGSANA
jgi:hypothetical protein